jgi:DNA-binding winged helix-turn-helix (wHTH) protein
LNCSHVGDDCFATAKLCRWEPAFDVLLALAERRERIVTKAELMDLVWPGLVVEEDNLQVQISSLRRLLGSDAIATIAGRGYQFTAKLEGDDRGPLPARSRSCKRPLPWQQEDRVLDDGPRARETHLKTEPPWQC